MPASDAINNSSRASLEQTFNSVVNNYIPKQRWLGVNNIYKTNIIEKLKDQPLKHKHLREYIASSTILHCFDGWNYIARSVESLLNNDIPSSIHFAYYAELRAAMSLLASEGIGIFHNRHYFLNTNHDCIDFRGGGTHQITNELMKLWANEPSKKEQIFSIIKAKNRNITEWFKYADYSTSSKYATEILNDWLIEWSLDLNLGEDQNLRSEMSYRPNLTPYYIDLKTTLTTIKRVWQSLEPTNDHRFRELDNHLFRISLEKAFSKLTGQKSSSNKYELFVDKMFDNAGEQKNNYFHLFLLRNNSAEDHVLLQNAKADRNKNSSQFPLAVISRGILLLRLASGLCDHLIKNAGIKIDSYKFWWEEIAFETGIIANKPSAEDPIDLFADINDALDNIDFEDDDIWISTKNINKTYSSELRDLNQFQRIGLWGIGL